MLGSRDKVEPRRTAGHGIPNRCITPCARGITLHAPCRSIPCHTTSSNDVRSQPTHISKRDAVDGGRRLPSSRRGFPCPGASQRRTHTSTDSGYSGREDLMVISHASAALHAPSCCNIVSANNLLPGTLIPMKLQACSQLILFPLSLRPLVVT